MINYSTLISHVRPFFLSRGGDDLAGTDRMLFYANCAIQDLYNIDSSTFTYTTETIPGVLNGTYNKFTTQLNIRKIQIIIGTMTNGSTLKMHPTLFMPPSADQYDKTWCKFETGTNEIITHKDIVSITLTYIKEYKWAEDMNLSDPIQLPNRYIPTVIKLMYDWASPINLMSGETAQVDFFSHAMTRSKQLADDDSLTDIYAINANY